MRTIQLGNKPEPRAVQFPVKPVKRSEQGLPVSVFRRFCGRGGMAGALLFVLGSGAVTAQPSADVAQRIEHIQSAILPSMLVKGEPPSTTTLADRMIALKVPGVSIAVIHEGKIEWARGFGVTRVGGPAVDAETLFQAASLSKPVTALAVLRLVESGKLDLDADVNQYLKTWKIPANTFSENAKVSLRRLLSHTAGVTLNGFPGYPSVAARPTVLQVLKGERPANTPAIRVDMTPGTKWRYSGGGFVVLQLLLEDETGQPFAQLMHDLVLAPIGMTRSTYEQPLPPERMAEAAQPYHADGQMVPGGPYVYPEMAPAGLWTTPSDFARYVLEIQKALAGKSAAVLSAAMAKKMLAPGQNRWGLGVATGGGAGHPYFTHTGSNEGYKCVFVAYDSGDGAVIMTNGDNGGPLGSEILRTIAREYGWPDFQPPEKTLYKGDDPKILARYVGSYRLASGAIILISLDGGQLLTKLGNPKPVPLFPESETMFFAEGLDAEFEFAPPGADGVPSQLILHQNGRNQVASRLSEAQLAQIEAEKKEIADATTAALKRFKDQTQDPRTEAALRRDIEELRQGKPSYEKMTSSLAEATRQGLPQLTALLAQFGAVKSVAFRGVGTGGADVYDVTFENGSMNWRVLMLSDEKIASISFRTL